MTRSVSFRKSKTPWLRARTVYSYSWRPLEDVTLATARGAAMLAEMERDPAPESSIATPPEAVSTPDSPILPLQVVELYRQFQQAVRAPTEDWEMYRKARAMSPKPHVSAEATTLLQGTYERFKR